MVGNFKLQSINMELQPSASWQELLIELESDLVCMTKVIVIIFTQKASKKPVERCWTRFDCR